jgi:hypothetical protein
MSMLKRISLATAALLVAGSAMATNFRGADQVYVPAAGHFSGASGTFISDVFVTNLSTTDTVTVSVIYATGNQGTQQSFPNLFDLAPKERREFVDFVATPTSQGGLGLTTAFGQLIFNGCKKGTDCGPATQDPTTGFSPNFRPISVETRVYSIPAGAALSDNPPPLTNGQLFTGFPWYNFVSQDQAANNLDKVFVTGLRQTGAPGTRGTYRSNIGVVNASQYSSTTMVITLFDGKTGAQLGQATVGLGPLGQAQPGLTALFPNVNFTTNGTNLWAEISQINSTAVGTVPDSCKPNGCPAFFAYGSVLDNGSGDATTLEPQYEIPLTDAAIACIYPTNAATSNCKGGKTIRRAVAH